LLNWFKYPEYNYVSGFGLLLRYRLYLKMNYTSLRADGMDETEKEYIEQRTVAKEENILYRRISRILIIICIGLCVVTPFVGFGMVRLCNISIDGATNWSLYVSIYIFFGVITILCLIITVLVLIIFGSSLIYCISQAYSVYTNYKDNKERQSYADEHKPLL
jgi:uncharacterized membrane protein